VIPVLALSCTSGILFVAVAFVLSRANESLTAARGLYWLGLGIIYVPIFVRLLARDISRTERIGLVVATSVVLYLLKILHDPQVFTYSDEFAHLVNAQNITETGRLYGANPILPQSAQYPGIAASAAAVSQVTGLGLFGSGLAVVGIARVLLLVGVLLLVERATASARVAGLAAIVYCANSNYLFYSAQFSYESLALPLMVVVLVCAARADRRDDPGAARAWTALGILITAALAPTHHLTSYALAAFLWLMVLVTVLTRRPYLRAPVALAIAATVTAAAWFLLVGQSTQDYLGSIFTRAYDSVLAERSGRAPFSASPGGGMVQTPVLDKGLALASVLITVVFVPWGVRVLRWRYWHSALVILFTLAGPAFLLTYSLRAFPGAWETANRASEFLYLGVALAIATVVALLSERAEGRRVIWLGALSLGAFVLFAGGSVLGWPSSTRLPPPLQVKAGETVIKAPGWTAAEWASMHLPADSGFVADDASGRVLAILGFRNVLSGRQDGATALLAENTLPPWQREILEKRRLGYVVVADRRPWNISNGTGYFFTRPGEDTSLVSPQIRSKFERLPGTSRVYDSGQLVIDDIRPAIGASPSASAPAPAPPPTGNAATLLMWAAIGVSVLALGAAALTRRLPATSRLALLGLASAGAAVLLLFPSAPILRIVIGLPLLLWAPGLAVVSALFGRQAPPWSDRALLVAAASLSVLIVGAVVLNALGVRLDGAAFLKLSFAVTLLAGTVALLRLGPGARLQAPRLARLPKGAAGPVLLALIAAVGCTLILRAPHPASAVPGYTALWALPEGDGIRAGIMNERASSINARLEVRRAGRVIGATQIRLGPGERWTRRLSPPPATGSTGGRTDITVRAQSTAGPELRRVWVGSAPTR
jgi:hypothetical protein